MFAGDSFDAVIALTETLVMRTQPRRLAGLSYLGTRKPYCKTREGNFKVLCNVEGEVHAEKRNFAHTVRAFPVG
jgi:hypothetical protein